MAAAWAAVEAVGWVGESLVRGRRGLFRVPPTRGLRLRLRTHRAGDVPLVGREGVRIR